MLYSKVAAEFIEENLNSQSQLLDSYCNSQQVFTGQYWDEFSIASLLSPPKRKLLLLGLGKGGGIRPLLSSNANQTIHAVDISKTSVNKCLEFYSSHFPKLKFSTVVADASNYLKSSKATYATICVDLYTQQGYLEASLTPNFQKLLKTRLASDGVSIWNSFGVANHLEKYTSESPSKNLASILSDHYEYVYELPHRRNSTFIASRQPISLLGQSSRLLQPQLKAVDQLYLDLSKLRLHYARLQGRQYLEKRVQSMSFDRIYQQQKVAWELFIMELNSNNSYGNAPQSIHYMNHIALCKSIAVNNDLSQTAKQLLLLNENTSIFLPTFLAAYNFESDFDLDWLFKLIFENAVNIVKRWEESFVLIHLPQLLSIILENPKKYQTWLPHVRAWTDRLLAQKEAKIESLSSC